MLLYSKKFKFIELFSSHQQENRSNLRDQNSRHADDELPVLCLMPELVHTGNASDAAADGRHEKQCGFRDPPEIFLGFSLVHQHKQKAKCIDYKQINQNQFCHGKSPFWRDVCEAMDMYGDSVGPAVRLYSGGNPGNCQ